MENPINQDKMKKMRKIFAIEERLIIISKENILSYSIQFFQTSFSIRYLPQISHHIQELNVVLDNYNFGFNVEEMFRI